MDCKKEKQTIYVASCSFGKDSIATILLALENKEPIDMVVFAEVMFDNEKNISGEIPEHINWIYNVAIPKLNEMGLKVDIVRSEKDYVSLCRKVLTKGKNKGKMYGIQNSFPCYANSELKIKPIKKYFNSFKGEYNIIQYIGIACDEPNRLKRLEGTNKVSLLDKYGYTEKMAMDLCRKYNLLSPLYEMGERGGCFFCYNANIKRYMHIFKNYPSYWKALKDLYHETKSKSFKYNKTIEDIEQEIRDIEYANTIQLKLFEI